MGRKKREREEQSHPETAFQIFSRCRIHTLKGKYPHFIPLQYEIILEEEWRVMEENDRARWIRLEQGHRENFENEKRVREQLKHTKVLTYDELEELYGDEQEGDEEDLVQATMELREMYEEKKAILRAESEETSAREQREVQFNLDSDF